MNIFKTGILRFLQIVIMIVAPLQSAVGQDKEQMPWAISGAGGVHFLVEQGELEVVVFKRDLNFRGPRGTHMTAILSSPSGLVLDTIEIGSTKGASGDPPGPVQSAKMSVQVDRPGIYKLMILMQGDPHGNYIEWAIETNAAAWVVETSRGHRDKRHREPIVMNNPSRSADVNFLPRAGEFAIEIEGLPADAEPLLLFDDTGALVARIPVVAKRSLSIREYMGMQDFAAEAEASAQFTVSASEDRGVKPWRLHLPQAKGFLEIDGLTRWQRDDLYRDQNIWTPIAESWFPFLAHRWMISPYHRTVDMTAGASGRMKFTVHNESPSERTVDLAIEFPGEPWEAELSERTVTLAPKSSREIEVHFKAPASGKERTCHVRVIPRQSPDITSYATLEVRSGGSHTGRPLNLPLVLKPFSHENRQFGYLPNYPVENQVYFDLQNRGFVVADHFLYRQEKDEWVTTDLREAVMRTVPAVDASDWRSAGSKVAFDAENNVYLIAQAKRSVALLRSTDGGKTFTAYLIQGREQESRWWDIEQFSGHNIPEGPPAVVRITRTEGHSASGPRWRRVNDLDLIVAEENAAGDLEFPEPVRLTASGLSTAMHSGIPSMLVSRGTRIFVTWGEVTDPGISREKIPGVPAYVAAYDRQTRLLSKPVFLSFGAPPNDGHNTPSITIDSEGYLHVVVGAHARPFQYKRSLQPNSIFSGWTESIPPSPDRLRQTYVGLVVDREDTLHLVFRRMVPGDERGYGAPWRALVYQRKRKGGEWESPVTLVEPPFSEYSIYYHRLTVDRMGRLFLNYDYWSTIGFYRNDSRGPVEAASGRTGEGWGRSVITSPDNGDTWRLW